MAHAAKIENGVVTQVIVVGNSDIGGDGFSPEIEANAQAFINSLAGLEGEWRLSSYIGNFRGRYAGVGDTFDEALDEFVSPIVATPEETPATAAE